MILCDQGAIHDGLLSRQITAALRSTAQQPVKVKEHNFKIQMHLSILKFDLGILF